MKPSQKALLSIIGFFALMILFSAAFSRAVVPVKLTDQSAFWIDPGTFANFNAVRVMGGWQLDLSQGEQWDVKWDESGSQYNQQGFQAYVEDQVLILKAGESGKWWGRDNNFSASIVMPELDGLRIEGSAQVELSGFDGDSLDIDVAGAAQVEGQGGRYEVLNLKSAGASDINLRAMSFDDAHVELAGASNVVLTMDGGDLSGSMAGAGQLLYYGEASDESVRVEGFGHVAQAD